MQWCPACAQPQPEGERCLDCGHRLPGSSPRPQEASAEELLQDALALVAQGRMLEAEGAFWRLWSDGLRDDRARLGVALVKTRIMPLVATSYLREAVNSEPEHEALWVMLTPSGGRFLWQQGAPAVVRALLDRRLDASALFTLDFALAESWSRPADSAPLWALKAEAELRAGRHEEALGALRQAQALGSKDTAVRYLDGLDLERCGERDEALVAYEAAEDSGLQPLVLFSKARLLAEMERLDLAARAAADATRLLPSHRASWSLRTRLALQRGRSAEAREGIERLQKLDEEPADAHRLPGHPAPGSLSIEARPARLFSIKLRRILEHRELLRPEQILVQDWCFGLPWRSERWPLGAFAGQNLLAEVITRGREAFVARHAPAPQLIGPAALGRDELSAWCMLLEGGQLKGVTFATNTLLSAETEADIERAKERLWEAAPEGCRGLRVEVVGERAGVLG